MAELRRPRLRMARFCVGELATMGMTLTIMVFQSHFHWLAIKCIAWLEVPTSRVAFSIRGCFVFFISFFFSFFSGFFSFSFSFRKKLPYTRTRTYELGTWNQSWVVFDFRGTARLALVSGYKITCLGFVAETGRFVAIETPWVRFFCLLLFVCALLPTLIFVFRFSFLIVFFPASRYVYRLSFSFVCAAAICYSQQVRIL